MGSLGCLQGFIGCCGTSNTTELSEWPGHVSCSWLDMKMITLMMAHGKQLLMACMVQD